MAIVGTAYNLPKAFIAFAREFIAALAREDFGRAVGRLDAGDEGRRWSKADVVAALARLARGRVTSPEGHTRSARPTCTSIEADRVFEVVHRLPIDGKWSDVVAVFRFSRTRGEYFRAQLVELRHLCRADEGA